MLQFFANADMTTLDWLSKRMGQLELLRKTTGNSTSTTVSLSKSQSRTDQSSWSRSTGLSERHSDMPDLQRLATREGANGLVPFLARAKASGTSTQAGRQTQEGATGGESIQMGDSSSWGTSDSATMSASIHQAPLMSLDEIARAFDHSTGRQIVFIDGVPVALMRTNYDQDSSF